MQGYAVEELVQAFLNGRQQAAEELLNRYGPRTYRAIRYLLFSSQDADDVYQEACIAAFANLKSLKDPSLFGSWLKQIAIRRAIDHVRKHRHNSALLDELAVDPRLGPEALVLQASTHERVRQAVASLPEHYRQVIVLFYWSECSYQEIAEALQIPKGTVMSRLNKAKRLLNDELSIAGKGVVSFGS